MMNIRASLLLIFVCIGSATYCQSIGVADNHVSVPPIKRGCVFDRTRAIFMKVKEHRPWEFPNFLENTVQFPVGTVVTVSRSEQSWSCVTGPVKTPSGWTTRTGWMKSSRLEPLTH